MLVDDIDGSEASETVSFGLDGRQFEIDLSAAHATELRNAFAEFVAAARRGSGSGRGRSAPRAAKPADDRDQAAAIREWAMANGQPVSGRGRISKSVMEAYHNRDAVAPQAETEAPKKPKKKRALKVAG